MKHSFKSIHKINSVIFAINIALYIIVYLGMIFQLILGLTQLILALLLLIDYKNLDKTTKSRLKIYWISVIIVFILIYINQIYILNDMGNLIILFIIPLIIASYFIYLTYNIEKKSFLTAKWTNLALFNYEIDAKFLEKYIPTGTELDIYKNKCYVSLVGFMFEDVKLLGLSIPFHRNFEEVNLRFYVKRFENGEWKRGVVFIKEIVPKPALTVVANTIYKEHYETLPMKHSVIENENTIDFVYQWKSKEKWNRILIETEKATIDIPLKSEADFITEHYFGYTKYKNNTLEYEVKHPRWQEHKVTNYQVDVDFGKTYGSEFEFLNHCKPVSVMLAKGSEISVENKKTLK